MMGGGCAVILHENLAAEPCVTTSDVGWIVNDDIPATKKNTHTHIKINIILNFSYFIFAIDPVHLVLFKLNAEFKTHRLYICACFLAIHPFGGEKRERKLLTAAGRYRVDWNCENILPGQSFPEAGLLSVSHQLSRKHEPMWIKIRLSRWSKQPKKWFVTWQQFLSSSKTFKSYQDQPSILCA